MRMILFFDLPMESGEDRREYARFRKLLVKHGFLMMQRSVYCKLAVNSTVIEAMLELVRKNKPPRGIIQALTITEKQYSRIDYILGERHGDILDTDERFVEL